MKIHTLIFFIMLMIPQFLTAVPTVHSNPTYNPNSDRAALQAQIMEYNVKYGHDMRLLYRAYSALVALYPNLIGLACSSQVPPGVNVFFTFKNPGYINTPGANEYCSVYFLPNVAETVVIPGGK